MFLDLDSDLDFDSDFDFDVYSILHSPFSVSPCLRVSVISVVDLNPSFTLLWHS